MAMAKTWLVFIPACHISRTKRLWQRRVLHTSRGLDVFVERQTQPERRLSPVGFFEADIHWDTPYAEEERPAVETAQCLQSIGGVRRLHNRSRGESKVRAEYVVLDFANFC
jgi:hypothetical protein